jgi:hypothetical protein
MIKLPEENYVSVKQVNIDETIWIYILIYLFIKYNEKRYININITKKIEYKMSG